VGPRAGADGCGEDEIPYAHTSSNPEPTSQ